MMPPPTALTILLNAMPLVFDQKFWSSAATSDLIKVCGSSLDFHASMIGPDAGNCVIAPVGNEYLVCVILDRIQTRDNAQGWIIINRNSSTTRALCDLPDSVSL